MEFSFFPGLLRVNAFTLFSAFLLLSSVNAQTTGEVRVLSIPENVSYVLDGKYRMADRQLTLTEGDHRFVFWAPEYAMLDTTIFVMGNFSYTLNVRLDRTIDFINYRNAVERYEANRRLGRWLPPVISVGLGAWAAVSTIRFSKAHEDLKDLQVRYTKLADPRAIEILKTEEIPAAKQDFNSARTQTFISSGLFIASIGAIAYIRSRQARSTPPVFEDRERVRFEGLVWVPGPAGGTWASGITIPLR
jgi:hypothetical protein